MTLTDIKLDNFFTVSPGFANQAVITDPDAGIKIVYSCDEAFNQWVIYNADGHSGFLCPEPYTWVTNAPNLPLPAEATGFRAVAPGETAVFSTHVTLKPL
jgi:aldose 1-epimerase